MKKEEWYQGITMNCVFIHEETYLRKPGEDQKDYKRVYVFDAEEWEKENEQGSNMYQSMKNQITLQMMESYQDRDVKKRLKEENEKLKESHKRLEGFLSNRIESLKDLEAENEKLKECRDYYMNRYADLYKEQLTPEEIEKVRELLRTSGIVGAFNK